MSIYEKLKNFFNLSFKSISLFSNSKSNNNKDSLEELSKELYSACSNDNLKSIDEITKKILLSPNKECFKHIFNTAVSISAWNDNLDAVRYFVSSNTLINSDTVQYIDIKFDTSFIQFACKHNNVDILHYLITDPGVINKLDIHNDNGELFTHVCKNGNIEIAQYLIFEQNIKKTEKISDYFLRFPNSAIEKMFDLRDLNESLVIELNSEPLHKKKIKL
jgi:hypothetical protein